MWPLEKNAPPPGGHVFQPTDIIFELFHEDWTINVASRVKNAPPLGSHVFQANANVDAAQRTTHDGQKAITKAHHEHIVLRTNAPPTGGHVFQATGTIFELVQNIIGTNLLTKFHDELYNKYGF
ncbi:hypothetical protein DPMN_188303 [Dreissena polymorpha]|uniref:Uncharacterized protein n=1 Tax=Dreissena polymorpha TaxID=45954 RepID=A0A9D4DRU4_DREPO|nr:hypothetical protein DPMN_188303 [Dreissena polymorpha]